MTTPPVEISLIRLNLKNDRRVQLEVYNQYAKRVYASALRIVKDSHEAEDIMQEAFIQAFDKIDRFRGDANLGTWICRIAINKSLDHLKKRKVALVFDENWGNHSDAQWEAEESNYDMSRIKLALADLPTGCRLIFELRMLEEMDYEAIAAELNMKEASVRVQYARARNRIIELVNETYV